MKTPIKLLIAGLAALLTLCCTSGCATTDSAPPVDQSTQYNPATNPAAFPANYQ